MSLSPLLAPGGNWLNKKTGIFDRIGSALFGDKDELIQAPTYTPEQQQALSSLLGQLGMGGGVGGNYSQSQNYLSRILSGDRGSFDQFAAPFRTEFQEQTVPRLAERFAGLGGGLGGGALGSSGFGQALGGAASQFQSNLSNLYAQMQQNAAQQAMGNYTNLANLGLGSRSFENLYQPGSTGLFGGLTSGFAGGAGQAAGMASMAKLLPLLL
jgi:hypothetical protein